MPSPVAAVTPPPGTRSWPPPWPFTLFGPLPFSRYVIESALEPPWPVVRRGPGLEPCRAGGRGQGEGRAGAGQGGWAGALTHPPLPGEIARGGWRPCRRLFPSQGPGFRLHDVVWTGRSGSRRLRVPAHHPVLLGGGGGDSPPVIKGEVAGWSSCQPSSDRRSFGFPAWRRRQRADDRQRRGVHGHGCGRGFSEQRI